MRVITESEGVRVEAEANGMIAVRLFGHASPMWIDPQVPAEALLAIVADRLSAELEKARSDGIGQRTHDLADARRATHEAIDFLTPARSPDTKQEEGR